MHEESNNVWKPLQIDKSLYFKSFKDIQKATEEMNRLFGSDVYKVSNTNVRSPTCVNKYVSI
jgi:hypothetical protein